jgi:uncharacterized protein involved in type VI secretion and phage assembly
VDNDPLEQLLDWVRNRHFGKYRGTVIDNADPTNRARLKVRAPAALGDLETWAMPCVPYAGDQVGFFFLPEPGTGVWVEFEAGDPSYAIWSGFFWGDDQLPPDATAATSKVIRTEKTTIVMNDDTPEIRAAVDDSGEVTIGEDVTVTRDQATLTVTTDGVTSEIGSGKVAVEQSGVSINSGALEVK